MSDKNSKILSMREKFKEPKKLSPSPIKKNFSEKKVRNNRGIIYKYQLKRKLIRLINASILLSDEKFLELKEDIYNDKYSIYAKKKLKEKRKTKKPFLYDAQQANVIISPKNTMRFEDEHISPYELFQRLDKKEKEIILSYPKFFGLDKYNLLEDLNITLPKNLTETLNKEENKNNKRNNSNNKVSFPKIKNYKANTILNESNSKSNIKYYKTFSNINIKNNKNSSVSTKTMTKNACFNSFIKNNNLKIKEKRNKLNEIRNELSKQNILKTQENEERHKKYFMRKNEILINYKKNLKYQSILNIGRHLKTQKEKEKKYKEKIFINDFINEIKKNYKVKEK